ncbi:hydroxyacid dehydrogenase [Labedella populi]|uniref:Hydroxyacid dehydrogenase n=1 Tax=Labedella populi TaxID=2498850 RepID=A0A3S4AV31_9MICO|nr:2-hydroxyacid dehydrogenase [Labedella populi]RWZ68034.1 hydroxyacid dehydrogenase [Labedella populi]
MVDSLIVSVPDSRLANAVGDLPDAVELVEWDFEGAPPRSRIDLVVPPYMGGSSRIGRVAEVSSRLVQSQSIGYDGVDELLPEGITFANASTVHETATAELALTLTLAAQRGLPEFVRNAESGTWKSRMTPGLADKNVMILGYGGVGRAIEDRLLPFETTVVRVASRPRTDDRGAVHGVDELSELLPEVDILIIVTPLTSKTTGLVNDDVLSALPDGALVVNVGRGPVADTDALVRHATEGRIRLALDVTDPEPLPEDHPLWSLPNVLISPHVGGASGAMLPRMVALIRRQIDHLLADEEPENIVLRT